MPEPINEESVKKEHPSANRIRYIKDRIKPHWEKSKSTIKVPKETPGYWESRKETSREFYELEQEGLIDHQTQILNRRGVEKRLDEVIARARREDKNRKFTVLFMDLNDLKATNTKSHSAGDELIKSTAGILSTGERLGQDIIGRYGGDEFIVVLEAPDVEAGRLYWERVHKRFREYEDSAHEVKTINVSAGMAEANAENLKEKIIVAEEAMRLAKRKIKNSQLGSFSLLQTEQDLDKIR